MKDKIKHILLLFDIGEKKNETENYKLVPTVLK